MSKTGLVLFAALILLTTTVPGRARGDLRRETTERRPYIVEIGEPYSITIPALERESRNISELGDYVAEYGSPDYAEIQEIAPDWPWETHEVRLYYLRRDLEADFGHVTLSSAMPNFGVRKYQGQIPPEKRHEIEVILEARRAPAAPPPVAPAMAEAMPVVEAPPVAAAPAEEPQSGGLTEVLVARIEAAAERAAQAADRAAEQGEAAVRAADRTVAIVEKIEQSGAPPQRNRTR